MNLINKHSLPIGKHSLPIGQKGIAHIFLLILLLAGIGLGVYLVSQKTNIFPKAASNPISSPCPVSAPCPSFSPIPSLSPTPLCDPKKFDAKTWSISDVGVCKKGKQNIRYICQKKRKIIQYSCPQSSQIPSDGTNEL